MGMQGVRLYDEDGNPYTINNPLPIEASITSNLNIATVTATRPMQVSATYATNTATNPLFVNVATNTSSGGEAVNVSTFTAQVPGLININTVTTTSPIRTNERGAMTGITSTVVTLNTTTVTAIPTANYANRSSMIVYNAGAATTTNIVYIGGNGVLTTTGFPLYAQERLTLDVNGTVTVYAIADLTGTAVRITEIG